MAKELSLIFEEAFAPSPSEIKILQESYDSAENGILYPKIKFRCVLQTANVRNQNGRVYSPEVLQQIVDQLAPKAESGSLLGELDHPLPETSDPNVLKKRAVTVSLKEVAVKYLDIQFDGEKIIAVAETLSTPNGLLLRSLIKDGVQIGFSLRALGSVEPDGQGNLIVGSVRAITFDVVSNPSHATAVISELIHENASIADVISEFSTILENVETVENGEKLILENTGDEHRTVCFNGQCARGAIEEIAEFIIENALVDEKLTKITLKI